MNNFICIYQTFDTFEANLIKSYLDNEDILCILKPKDASGVLPHLGFSQGGIDIMVHEDNLEEAKKILKEIIKD